MNRQATTKILTTALSFLLISGVALADDAISDLLIVLDSDGRTHTVQHTIASHGPEVSLRLPGSVIPQEVMFFGVDRQAAENAFKQNPAVVSVSSAGAFVRYQHQYGSDLSVRNDNQFQLNTMSVPSNLLVLGNSGQAQAIARSSITWVMPTTVEIVSYSSTDANTGKWVLIDNALSFYHLGGDAVQLTINYQKRVTNLANAPQPCGDAVAGISNCSDDTDEDGVPDYRDICRTDIGQTATPLGCSPNQSIILSDVVFATGRTYLDVAARKQLDKVANAILNTTNRYFEIGAHTDNTGKADNNQQLSQKRADAVRQYLMLRGVSPNVVSAEGYGEAYPIRDNATSDGQRANRRIELSSLE